MGATETAQGFKKHVDIIGDDGSDLSGAFAYVLGSGSRFFEQMYWKTDENGFHVLRRTRAVVSVEGWETIGVLDFPVEVMSAARHWVNGIPDEYVVNYMLTVEPSDPLPGSRQRGWRFLVDDECLGACRVIPTFG